MILQAFRQAPRPIMHAQFGALPGPFPVFSAHACALHNNPIRSRSDSMTKYRSPIFMMSAGALYVVLASGCTDLKPVQAQLDDLKSQLSKLSPQIASADSQAIAAASSARSAAATAQRAQSTADSANATAKNSQQAIEAINEKIDRMFKKSRSK
jgi:outer membrane murein-binding lipoprotein Lpp